MKKRLIFTFIFLLLGSISIACGSYLIDAMKLLATQVVGEQDENICKVTFSGSTNKTMYVKKEDKISAKDAPYLSDGNGYYTWVDSSNNISLNDINSSDGKGLSNEIIVSKDLNFKAIQQNLPNQITDVNSLGNYTVNDGRGYVWKDGDEIKLCEENYNLEGGNTSNSCAAKLTLNNGIYNNLQLTLNYRYNKLPETWGIHYQEYENAINLSNARQVNNDTTIGLEDPTCAVSDYKPLKNSGKNYCVSRIKLGKDTILTGSTKLIIGAYTGFYGNNQTWSQINFQGFIMGAYNELDLNGHTLILENGSEIYSLGSITDTSPDRSGKIILRKGSKLTTTFVVEDQHHETAGPMTYIYGGPFFGMYRAPYLDCNIQFDYGSEFYGRMMLDWGGSVYSGYSINTLNIIGNSTDDSFIFDFYNNSNEYGYIERKVKYNSEMKHNFSSFETNNIMQQKIEYNFYNVNIRANLPKNLSVKIGSEINVNFNKSMWFIPPYFDFNLFSSVGYIMNYFVFFPGANLMVDENSKIVLDYGSEDYLAAAGSGNFAISAQHFVRVGSLNFLFEKYEYNENKTTGDLPKFHDSGDTVGAMMTGNAVIYNSASNFRKYNNNKHAIFTLNGTIDFADVDADRLPNLNNGSLPYYQLGGTINIKNEFIFKDSVKSSGNVQLFATSYKSGPDRLTNGDKQSYHRLNISDYFSLPLVSNGNVLMNLENPLVVRDNFNVKEITYDFGSGLINDNINRENYGFFPLKNNSYNTSLAHLNRAQCNNINDFYACYDDLAGKFLKVNVKNLPGSNNNEYVSVNDSSVIFNGQNFAFFRGVFTQFRVNGSNFQINLQRYKMVLEATAENYMNAKFVSSDDAYYTHPARRLS